MSKYGVISGPYFPVFGLNTGKHRPEITLYLDTFQAVHANQSLSVHPFYIMMIIYKFQVILYNI